MARKGILVSDPVVARTTEAQWLWEYLALRKKEREDRQFYIDALKNILIGVLGLRVPVLDESGVPKQPEDMTDEDKESFVPFIFLGGNHRLLGKYFEKFNTGSTDTDPMSDAAFDAISRKMADDDADMMPVVDPYAGQDISQIIRSKEHEALGVIDPNSPKPVKIPHKAKVQSKVSFEDP